MQDCANNKYMYLEWQKKDIIIATITLININTTIIIVVVVENVDFVVRALNYHVLHNLFIDPFSYERKNKSKLKLLFLLLLLLLLLLLSL